MRSMSPRPALSTLRVAQTSAARQGRPVTLLGIGPMSDAVLQASFEVAKEDNLPLFFISSRNQVDTRAFGGGYVRGWDQEDFCAAVDRMAEITECHSLYYICRDHGGLWQRDEERKARLPEDEAMARAKESYLADLKAGFDLLHVDPTRDPHEDGPVPLDTVMRRTVELISI